MYGWQDADVEVILVRDNSNVVVAYRIKIDGGEEHNVPREIWGMDSISPDIRTAIHRIFASRPNGSPYPHFKTMRTGDDYHWYFVSFSSPSIVRRWINNQWCYEDGVPCSYEEALRRGRA